MTAYRTEEQAAGVFCRGKSVYWNLFRNQTQIPRSCRSNPKYSDVDHGVKGLCHNLGKKTQLEMSEAGSEKIDGHFYSEANPSLHRFSRKNTLSTRREPRLGSSSMSDFKNK